jgi:hypothetical protein
LNKDRLIFYTATGSGDIVSINVIEVTMNDDPTSVDTSAPVQQAPQEPLSPAQEPIQPITSTPKKNKGLKRLLLGVSIFGLLAAAGVGHYMLVYLPNTPENVLKKAVANFASDKNYSIAGRLDHGDGNLPDFDYTIKVVGSSVYATVDSSSFMMGPKAELMSVDGKNYVKTSAWMNPTELSKQYTNYGPKGLQENLAEFAETSGVFTYQDTWMQIDDFVFDAPSTNTPSTPQTIEEAGVSLKSIETTEEVDGVKLRNYKVSLTKDGFVRLLDQISGSQLLSNGFEAYSSKEGFPETVDMDVKVDISTKKIHSLSYSGRPFRDATLSMNLTPANDTITAPQNAPLVSDTLDYGIVKTIIFNPIAQNANDASDRERIADIKGIKMAMEIYHRKNDKYPTRGFSVVTVSGNMSDAMRGADNAIFDDPNGKRFNWHGSQYTYIGEAPDSSEMCGTAYYDMNTGKDIPSPDCSKFWVVTSLNNGQEFKLTSDQQ